MARRLLEDGRLRLLEDGHVRLLENTGSPPVVVTAEVRSLVGRLEDAAEE